MRRFIPFAIAITIIIGCSKRDSVENSTGFVVPENYRNWIKPISNVLDYPISGHGNSVRVIYANDIAYKAVARKNEEGLEKIIMPDGSIVIKEIYDLKEHINIQKPILTIMVKDRNNKKSMAGWLSYMKKPDDKPTLVEGKMCIGCHEAANDQHPYFDKNKKGIFRDYLFIKTAK